MPQLSFKYQNNTLNSGIAGLDVDTAFQVNSVSDSTYNGTFVVTDVTTQDADGKTTVFNCLTGFYRIKLQ